MKSHIDHRAVAELNTALDSLEASVDGLIGSLDRIEASLSRALALAEQRRRGRARDLDPDAIPALSKGDGA